MKRKRKKKKKEKKHPSLLWCPLLSLVSQSQAWIYNFFFVKRDLKKTNKKKTDENETLPCQKADVRRGTNTESSLRKREVADRTGWEQPEVRGHTHGLTPGFPSARKTSPNNTTLLLATTGSNLLMLSCCGYSTIACGSCCGITPAPKMSSVAQLQAKPAEPAPNFYSGVHLKAPLCETQWHLTEGRQVTKDVGH